LLLSGGTAFASGKAGSAKPAKSAPAGKVNLNTASAQDLATLPGVGDKVAARIIEYRQKAGGFKSVQELLNVRGVGEKNFAKMQAHLTLGDAPKSANR
jgi:competence protein ComEA